MISEGTVEAIIGLHNPYRVGSADMVYSDKATQAWSANGVTYQGGVYGRDVSHYMAASFTKIFIALFARAHDPRPVASGDASATQP